MKFKIYQLPFMLIILAMPIPWASSFPSLGLVTWLPEMVAIFIYLYMFSSGKFNLTFKKSHFIVVLILFVHLVYQIVSGKGVGGGAIISVSLMSVLFFNGRSMNNIGVWYAISSGALTSGVGYAIWYTALPGLNATRAATVQLSVPVIAAFGGIVFLGEPISLRLAIVSVAILGGIALVILEKQHGKGA